MGHRKAERRNENWMGSLTEAYLKYIKERPVRPSASNGKIRKVSSFAMRGGEDERGCAKTPHAAMVPLPFQEKKGNSGRE